MSEASVVIRKHDARGMITLRGDLSSAEVSQAIKAAVKSDVPNTREVVVSDVGVVAWMSPDEVLLTCDYDAADQIAGSLREHLTNVHHLVAVVSDARASFTIEGQMWRDVLAKGMPIDFRPSEFGSGQIRRSRLGQVAAAIWCTSPDSCELVCFQSVSEFVHEWLTVAARDEALPVHF